MINTYNARDWEYLSDPILVADIDLKTARRANRDHATVAMTHTGLLNGILVYFERVRSPEMRHLITEYGIIV